MEFQKTKWEAYFIQNKCFKKDEIISLLKANKKPDEPITNISSLLSVCLKLAIDDIASYR